LTDSGRRKHGRLKCDGVIRGVVKLDYKAKGGPISVKREKNGDRGNGTRKGPGDIAGNWVDCKGVKENSKTFK